MKKNEWKQTAKEAKQRSAIEPNRRCKNCGEPLDFGDVRCPNCGADAHVRKVPYDEALKTEDIQPRPRTHEGTGPQTADIDVGEGMLSKLDLFLPLFSLAAGVVALFAVDGEKPAIFKICVALLTAVGLWLFSTLFLIIAKNLASIAQNQEKEVGNTSFIIRQLNEFLDKYDLFLNNYDDDSFTNQDDAKELHRQLSRIIRLNEQQLGKKPRHRHHGPVEDMAEAEETAEEPVIDEREEELNEEAELIEEEIIEEEAAAEQEPEIIEEEAPVQEKSEEKKEVKEEKPEKKPENKPEKKDRKKDKIKKKVVDLFEDDEEENEEIEEPLNEDSPASDAPSQPDKDEFDGDDEAESIECPHCGSVNQRTVSQLAAGTVACDVCGGMFKVDIAEEDEEYSDDWDSGIDNDDGFFDGKGDISRLDSIFDDK